jgi:hypothetical protein
LKEKIQKERKKREKQGIKAGNHKRDDKRKSKGLKVDYK